MRSAARVANAVNRAMVPITQEPRVAKAERDRFMWIFLLVIVLFSAMFVVASAWLVRLFSGYSMEDTQGRDSKKPRGMALSLWNRLRTWLLQKPARLDYRRDQRGRFRKVRRG